MRVTAVRAGLVWGGAATVVAATIMWASPLGAQDSTDLCARFGDVDDTRGVASAELRELSGMVASTAHDDVLWAHNDGGGGNRLYAVALDGSDLGSYEVKGARNRDWEDIAAGTTTDGAPVLYVGSIGDNAAERESALVHIVAEPAAAPDGNGGALETIGTVTITYPGGPSDAEALLVDPVSGDAVIITTSETGESHVMSVAAEELAPDVATEAIDTGLLAVPAEVLAAGILSVTAADISPDGSIVLVRTTTHVLAYPRAEGQTVADALAGTACLAPAIDEPNPQAISFSGDGSTYLLAGEVAGAIDRGELPPGSATKLTSIEVLAEPAPPTTEPPASTEPPATTEAPPSTEPTASTEAPASTEPTGSTEVPAEGTVAPGGTSTPDESDIDATSADDDGDGFPMILVAAGAAVVLALVVVLIVVRNQRRRPLPGSAPLTDTEPLGRSAAGVSMAPPPTGSPLPPPVAPTTGDDTPPSGQPLPPPSV